MNDYFKLQKYKTSVKQEFIAALVTFCSMVYILIVNANMYTNPFGNGENVLGLPFGAIYIGTALSAVVGCFLMGFIAKLPLALASGMGLNAFFVYTVCISFGFAYEVALLTIFNEGLIFLILTKTGCIKKIYDAIPNSIRYSIPAGIGLFIALLGFQNSGIIVSSPATGLALNSFNLLSTSWQKTFPAFITLFCLFVIAILTKKNVKGSVLWGMLSGVFLYYLIIWLCPSPHHEIKFETLNPLVSLKEFYDYSFGKVFSSGFDFSDYIVKFGLARFLLIFITTTISFCLVDIFDNIGSLHAACDHGNLLKNNSIPNLEKAMEASSLSAIAGSAMGISTVTTYIESSTGIAEGGRTGLTAIFVGVLFFIAAFLSPVAQLVPGCATSSALIYVGVLMMSSVRHINWHDIEDTLPAFLTICMMPYTCNISNGIAFGLLAYAVIKAFTGKVKEIKFFAWIIIILFLATLLLSH